MAGRWFSPRTPVSFTNKTDHHDITELLLKVALNTTTLTLKSLYLHFVVLVVSFIGERNRRNAVSHYL